MKTIREHLKDRHMNIELYNSVWICEEERTATFGLYNLSGVLVGYQQYRPDITAKHDKVPRNQRYYSYVSSEGVSKALAVFGLETVDMMNDDVIVVTEGIFDICRVHNLGLPGVAVLCNNPEHLKEWLALLPMKKVVIIDNDENKAGNKLTRYGDTVIIPSTGDLGDQTDEDVRQLLRKYL